jgi:dihydrofolate reductase
MGKLVYGMMQSLDGYVAGAAGDLQMPRPGERLHRHFNDTVRASVGIIYGRRMYEVMRYWDDDHRDWDAVARDFAAAWRAKPKWVVSRTLESVSRMPLLSATTPERLCARSKRSSTVRSMLPDPSWLAVSLHSG